MNTLDNLSIIVAVAKNGAIGLNNELLYRLPADLKAAVTDAGAEATKLQRASNAAAQAVFRESLAKHGMQVNEVPDKAAFRRGVMPMYESFRGQIGTDIIKEALAAVQ